MASTITKPKRQQQQLRELLQQKQEPFVLDLYLFEKGYLKKSLSSKLESTQFGCCYNGNSNNNLSTKSIPSCSRILRAILNKLTPSNKRRNSKTISDGKRGVKFSVNDKHRNTNNNNNNSHEIYERHRLSSASSTTTVFNSPTSWDKNYDDDYDSVIADTLEGLRLSNMAEEEACAGRDFQCPFMANNKQLSPVSVLDQFPQSKHCFRTRQDNECQTTCTVRLPSKLVVQDSTTLSASLCQINFDSVSDMSIRNNNDSPQFVFDCVREIIVASNGNKKMMICHNKGLFGNLVLEAWDNKQIGIESNALTLTLLDLDIFNNSSHEWKNGFDFEKRKISLEIGDSIAEDIVIEIIAETLNPE